MLVVSRDAVPGEDVVHQTRRADRWIKVFLEVAKDFAIVLGESDTVRKCVLLIHSGYCGMEKNLCQYAT